MLLKTRLAPERLGVSPFQEKKHGILTISLFVKCPQMTPFMAPKTLRHYLHRRLSFASLCQSDFDLDFQVKVMVIQKLASSLNRII
jgi:hypothetical protein